MTEQEMRALLDRWNHAFSHLAPGSEFIDDPERTAKQVGRVIGSRKESAYRQGYIHGEAAAKAANGESQ